MKIIQEDTKYFYIEIADSEGIAIQVANVYFKRKEKGVWEFGNCDYQVDCGNRNYSLQDWIFLGQVSKFIQEKLQELNQEVWQDDNSRF